MVVKKKKKRMSCSSCVKYTLFFKQNYIYFHREVNIVSSFATFSFLRMKIGKIENLLIVTDFVRSYNGCMSP